MLSIYTKSLKKESGQNAPLTIRLNNNCPSEKEADLKKSNPKQKALNVIKILKGLYIQLGIFLDHRTLVFFVKISYQRHNIFQTAQNKKVSPTPCQYPDNKKTTAVASKTPIRFLFAFYKRLDNIHIESTILLR